MGSPSLEISPPEEDAKYTDESESQKAICEKLSSEWWMARNTIRSNKADTSSCVRCSKTNYIYYFHIHINKFLYWLYTLVEGIFTGASAFDTWFKSTNWTGAAIKQAIQILMVCGKKLMLYIWMKTMENISKSNTTSNTWGSWGGVQLSSKFLLVNFIYMTNIKKDEEEKQNQSKGWGETFKDLVLSTKLSDNVCDFFSQSNLDQVIDDKYSEMLKTMTDDVAKNNKNPQVNNINNPDRTTNINGYVDLGQKSNNINNDSEATTFITGITKTFQTYTLYDASNVEILLNSKADTCWDYWNATSYLGTFLGSSKYNGTKGLSIFDVYEASQKDDKNRNLIYNYIMCRSFGIMWDDQILSNNIFMWFVQIPTTFFYVYGYIQRNGFTNLYIILSDILSVCLVDELSRKYLLTWCFGNESISYNNNSNKINVPRDYIEKAIDEIYASSLDSNGNLEFNKFNDKITKECSAIFDFLKQYFYTFIDEIKRYFSSINPNYTLNNLKSYDEYDNANQITVLNYNKTGEDKLKIKYYIDNAVKELRDDYKFTLNGAPVFIDNYVTSVTLNQAIQNIDAIEKSIRTSTTLKAANIIFEDKDAPTEDAKKMQLIQFLNNLKLMMVNGYKKIQNEDGVEQEATIKLRIQEEIRDTKDVDPVIKYQVSNYNFLKKRFNGPGYNLPDPELMRITLCNKFNTIKLFYFLDIKKEKCIEQKEEFSIKWSNTEDQFNTGYLAWKAPSEEEPLLQVFDDYLFLKLGNYNRDIYDKLASIRQKMYEEIPIPLEKVDKIFTDIQNFLTDEIEKVKIVDPDEDRQQKKLWADFKKKFNPENDSNKSRFQNEINEKYLVDVNDYDFSSKVSYINYIMQTNMFTADFEKMNLKEKDNKLIKYYLLSKIKNPGVYIDLETIYFNIEENDSGEPIETSEIPPSGIPIIDERLRDYNFIKKLYKAIGYVLIQDRDERLQEYTFKDNLRVIKNTQLDNNVNNLFLYDEFTKKINGNGLGDLNENFELIIISLKEKGLYLIQQDKTTLLCNTEEGTYDNNDIESNLNKIHNGKYFNEISKNGGLNPPPILYDYESPIKTKTELDANISQLGEFTIKISERVEYCVGYNFVLAEPNDKRICEKELNEMRAKYRNLLEKLFVYKNYDFVLKKGKWVGILKADVSLYKMIYNNFEIDKFAENIVDDISKKEEEAKKMLDKSMRLKGWRHWWWEKAVITTGKYIYGYEFSYFNTLKIKGGLKKWDNTVNMFKDINTVEDMPPELKPIIPISVVYQNLYSRVIGKVNSEDNLDPNGNVVLSNGKNYVFRQNYQDQWISVEKAKE